MSDHKSFNNPPITEAILAIKVNLLKDTTVSALENIHDDIKDQYPVKEIKMEWKTNFEVKPGYSSVIGEPITGPVGYMFAAANKSKLVQAKLDGYSYNKLKPYGHWVDFKKEGLDKWERYKTIAQPTLVTRLALRYINNIVIPLPVENYKAYLKTLPDMTRDIPYELTNYFMRITITNTETMINANVVTVINPTNVEKSVIPIILDIETFVDVQLKPNNTKAISDILEKLRQEKNSLFLENITKKTQELFN